MLNRRRFVFSSGCAAGALLGAPALAQQQTPDRKTYVVPPEHMPREVRLRDDFEPGQILVDPNTFSLYWTQEKKRALRFVVGVGRGDLYEPGSFFVGAKKE
jgi:DMSO/TMAO reductase YedYZ molybdopterin-dependent catalytic subunit